MAESHQGGAAGCGARFSGQEADQARGGDRVPHAYASGAQAMRRILAALSLFTALFAPAAASAVNPKALDMGKNVQVWYVEDHTLPMIAITAALPAGSAYDPKNKAGLAAFT